MTDQLRISDSGDIEVQPVTSDGQPLWSPDTLREEPHLFSPEAFEQLRGQRGWRLVRCHSCRQDFYTDPQHIEHYCPTCMGTR